MAGYPSAGSLTSVKGQDTNSYPFSNILQCCEMIVPIFNMDWQVPLYSFVIKIVCKITSKPVRSPVTLLCFQNMDLLYDSLGQTSFLCLARLLRTI